MSQKTLSVSMKKSEMQSLVLIASSRALSIQLPDRWNQMSTEERNESLLESDSPALRKLTRHELSDLLDLTCHSIQAACLTVMDLISISAGDDEDEGISEETTAHVLEPSETCH